MKISLIIPTRTGISKELKTNISKQDKLPDEIIEVIGEGLTIQRNEAVKRATGDIIVFIDDDIIMDKYFLYSINYNFIYKNEIMAVTANPKIKSYKPNILWDIYAKIFMLTYRSNGKFLLSGFSTNYDSKIRYVTKSEVLHGCCMAMSKEIFWKYKFNENLVNRMYGEDDYFANEIMQDYPIYYNPHAICYDNRPYPKGNQSQKIRSTMINLILRHRMKKRSILEALAFIWAMIGFSIFKIVESIIMLDISILLGLLLCFKSYEDKPVEEIRKNIKINVYDNQWRLKCTKQ